MAFSTAACIKVGDHGLGVEAKRAALLAINRTGRILPTTRKAIELAEGNRRRQQERYGMQPITTTGVLDAQTLLSKASNH